MTDAGTTDGTDAHDTPMPDPPLPVSLPCNGVLGFPGVPMLAVDTVAFEIADVTGDGIHDVIHANLSTIRVAKGLGDGTFAALSSISVPMNSAAFDVMDVNGDSKPDLIYGGSQQKNLYVVLNDGTGLFGSPTSYDATLNIGSVDAVDLTGDGKPDLVARASSGGDVAVLINTATSFGAAQTYDLGMNTALEIAIGDLTGDNRPDIVATNSNTTVNVLVNTGTGAFAAPVTYNHTNAPSTWGIALADLNEDGKLDVALGTQTVNDSLVAVMLNTGSGALGAPTTYLAGDQSSDLSRVLAAADMNGDGHVDIAAAYKGDDGASVMLGTGTGQLVNSIVVDVDGRALDLALGDLNGDARIDLALWTGSGIVPYLNNGATSMFELRNQYTFEGSLELRGARMTDINSDGWVDLLGIAQNDPPASKVVTRVATGAGEFDASTSAFAATAFGFRSLLADLDNDTRLDLVIIDSQESQAIRNNGDGTLSPGPPFMLANYPSASAIKDVNGDGFKDVLIAETDLVSSGRLEYFAGIGDGSFAAGVTLVSGSHIYGMAVLDLDNNGKPDIVLHRNVGGYQEDVMFGNGDGTFGAPVRTTVDPPGLNLVAQDVNGDGNVDLVGTATSHMRVMLSNGDGTLAPPLSMVGLNGTDRAFGDLNGDGSVDMVTNSPYSVVVQLGRGDGTFLAPVHYHAGNGVFSVSLKDVDHDGRVDLLVNNERDQVSVLRGRCLE
ncbi:MAG: FG-GAP repeat domain-containing protein [Kofleriaceae bacterium]